MGNGAQALIGDHSRMKWESEFTSNCSKSSRNVQAACLRCL